MLFRLPDTPRHYVISEGWSVFQPVGLFVGRVAYGLVRVDVDDLFRGELCAV
jgi:hypothetical protein